MKQAGIFATAAGLALGLNSTGVLAHHSFLAEFDPDSPIELEGTVIKVEWTNPHTFFYIEVETADGDFEEWALEMSSPNGLTRRGWSRCCFQVRHVPISPLPEP